MEMDVVARAISDMVNAVNQGHFTAAITAFTEAAVIIEDIAPFRWHGAGTALARRPNGYARWGRMRLASTQKQF